MSRFKILGIALACLIGLGSAIPVHAELVTYPRSRTDADLPLSSVYEVTVEQGGITRSTVVYQSLSNGSVEGGRNDAVKSNSIAWTQLIEAINGANDIWVEGLVISQASAFNVRLLGTDNDIHWVKTPGGWRFNNDGLVGYARTRISNCLVWANDDGIKLYRDDQIVSDIVAWHLTNGGVFQWCWSAVSAKNIRVQRVDVIRGQWPSDGQNQGVFNVRGSQSVGAVQVQEDWVFDDIRVETPVAVLFNLAPQVDHIVRDVTFRNVQAKVTANVVNRIEGNSAAAPLTDVSFEGLRLNGTCINASNAASTGKFQIANAQRVTFAGCLSTGIEGVQPSSRTGNENLGELHWSVRGRDLGGRIVPGP